MSNVHLAGPREKLPTSVRGARSASALSLPLDEARLEMWRQGSASVQREDALIETLSAEDARAHLGAMPPEQRRLSETVNE